MSYSKEYNTMKPNQKSQINQSNNIIEEHKTLSQSMVWKLQADYYSNQGPEAWRKGIVPQYITTNPYIANLYAKTVFGYCRDLVLRDDFDKNTTVYIMELAAGVGRFTYTFLKRFLKLLEKSSFNGLKFKYIVTDLAERNVEYWQNHSFLKPYFESGILDCATYDMTCDEKLILRNSGEVLKVGTLKNPLILFANYTFDSLPQDTFYVNKSELYEGLITLSSKENTNEDNKDNSILSGLDYEYSDHLLEGNTYYAEAQINDILLYYKSRLEDSAFSIPIIALRCIDRLQQLFGDDMILISADKGYRNLDSMFHNYHPYLSEHGSISLTVNFHAMELYFKNHGGKAIHSIYDHENVTMSLFLLSQNSHSFSETEMAYNEIIESIGPDDFHTIKKSFLPHINDMKSKELLTFLRYTFWDSRTFLEFYNTLLERISEEENFPKDELIDVIHLVWEHYFPIGEEGDLAYCLGTLLAYFEHDLDAIKLFQSSLEFYGENAAIYYEIALCYYNMQDLSTSLDYLEKSLEIQPNFEESIQLKSYILV